jgi:hypothetical protein
VATRALSLEDRLRLGEGLRHVLAVLAQVSALERFGRRGIGVLGDDMGSGREVDQLLAFQEALEEMTRTPLTCALPH